MTAGRLDKNPACSNFRPSVSGIRREETATGPTRGQTLLSGDTARRAEMEEQTPGAPSGPVVPRLANEEPRYRVRHHLTGLTCGDDPAGWLAPIQGQRLGLVGTGRGQPGVLSGSNESISMGLNSTQLKNMCK